MRSSVTEGDWRDLVEKIKSNECTPFLGAGANAGVLPSGADLAKDLVRDYTARGTFTFPFADKQSDLPTVAQFLAVKKYSMWPKEQVAQSFRHRLARGDIDDMLRRRHPVALLAEMPFAIFMTTNYDDLLFRALRLRGKAPISELCAWNNLVREQNKKNSAEHQAHLSDPTQSNPVVFHLHGHYRNAVSMVLTEDDYYRFIIKMTQPPKTPKDALLPPMIQEAAKSNMLLFIGYSLNDLTFRVLFQSLFTDMDERYRTMSLAIQLPSTENPEAQEYLRRYYEQNHIKLFYEDANEFVTKLNKRWRLYGDHRSAA